MKLLYASQFKRDFKKIKKQNRNLELLKQVVDLLLNDELLPAHYMDHRLLGEWKNTGIAILNLTGY